MSIFKVSIYKVSIKKTPPLLNKIYKEFQCSLYPSNIGIIMFLDVL